MLTIFIFLLFSSFLRENILVQLEAVKKEKKGVTFDKHTVMVRFITLFAHGKGILLVI